MIIPIYSVNANMDSFERLQFSVLLPSLSTNYLLLSVE